jgi:hypothetical protein
MNCSYYTINGTDDEYDISCENNHVYISMTTTQILPNSLIK